MALLFIDGFDAADMSTKWSVNSNSTSSTTTRFSNGRSLGLGSGGTRYVTKYFAASAEVYICFAASGLASGFNGITFMYVYTDGGLSVQLSLQSNSNGSISLMRGGTQLAVTAAGLLFSTWSYIELRAKIDPSAGVATLKVNGNIEANFSGNTKNTGTSNNVDGIAFTNSGTLGGVLLDDLYILDATGSAPYNTYLGDVRVYTMSPSGAGNTTQFTPSSGANYTTVDELPYSAADYVSATGPTTKDTYAMADLPAGVSTIYGVQTNIIAKKTDAGSIAIKPIVRSGGTDYAGATTALPASDATIIDVRSQDPSTSAAWTSAGVNGMEAGMEIA